MPTAVITGSSSGIGASTANLFAERGWSVLLHGCRNLSGLQQAAERACRASHAGSQIVCVTADVSHQQHCRQFVEFAFHRFGPIDAWINLAGADILTQELRCKSFEERLQELWNVDVVGTIRLCRQVVEQMRDFQDHTMSIVNIGWDQSSLGMEGEPGQLFCPTKAAVAAFSQSLALTEAPHVRVNTVAPGWIRTAWGEQEASDYWHRRATTESLLNRWGTPLDVAETIFWLTSPAAAFINGQTIAVNGGRRYSQPSPSNGSSQTQR